MHTLAAQQDETCNVYRIELTGKGLPGSKCLAEVEVFSCVPAAQVGRENLVGEENRATLCMMRNLEIERVTLAAMGLGIARCGKIEGANKAE